MPATALALACALLTACGDSGQEGSGHSRVANTTLVSLRGGGPLIGLADNRPETLTDPRFRATGIKRVRVAVPYDDLEIGGDRAKVQDAYFRAARAQGVEPLVSFYRSTRNIDLLPSADEFRIDFRRFRKRYPWVRNFSTWNEANFHAQPTARNPERTARFYRILRDECAGGRCTVVTCDFRADGTPEASDWLRRFKREIGPGRHVWGLVPYVDVNRRSTALTQDFLRQTKGPVWVDEVGAINVFGRGIRSDVKRQSRAMAYLLADYARVSPRVRRMYVYHWRAAAGDNLFDSALLDADGRPRPAYLQFVRAIGRVPR